MPLFSQLHACLSRCVRMILLDIIFYVNPFQDFFKYFFFKAKILKNRTQLIYFNISSLIPKGNEIENQ